MSSDISTEKYKGSDLYFLGDTQIGKKTYEYIQKLEAKVEGLNKSWEAEATACSMHYDHIKDLEKRNSNLTHGMAKDLEKIAKLEKELAELKDKQEVLISALEIYADEGEWYKDDPVSHWELLFNSTDVDNHGWYKARLALNMVVNLCDNCQYDFGSCNSKPTFGCGRGYDNVIKCSTRELPKTKQEGAE